MKKRILSTVVVTTIVCATAFTLFGCGGDSEPAKYTVTYVSGAEAATGEAPAAVSYAEGETVTVAANTFTYTGYTFTAWSDGETTYAPNATFQMPAKDVTLTAQWQSQGGGEVTKYTVTFKNGDTVLETKEVESGGKIVLPSVPTAPDGKEFDCWVIEGTTTKVTADTTVTGAMTVVVQWKDKAVDNNDPVAAETGYTVDREAASKIIPPWDPTAQYYVGEGETVTVKATVSGTVGVNEGWKGLLSDIFVNGDFYRCRNDGYIFTWKNLNSNDHLNDLHATINWLKGNADTYIAMFADGATVVQVASLSLADNVLTYKIANYAATDTNFENPVTELVYEITSTENISETTIAFWIDGGLTMSEAVAKYPTDTNMTYQVTFDYNGGSPADVAVDGAVNAVLNLRKDSNYTFGVDPVRTGYVFAGWTSSDETDAEIYFAEDTVPVTGEVTYTAQWTQVYGVAYAAGENDSTVTDLPTDTNSYKAGDTVTLLTAPTSTGYNFEAWIVKNGEETVTVTDGTFTMPAGAVTITATWTIKTFTVTYEDGVEDEEINVPAQDTVNWNASHTVEAAIAREGYTFRGWLEGTTLHQPGDEITVTGNVTLTADWVAVGAHTVTYVGVDVASTSHSPNATVTLPAVPEKQGYTFTGWEVMNGDEEITVTEADGTYTFTMPEADVTATAVYTINTYTVTFKNGDTTVGTAAKEYNSAIGEWEVADPTGSDENGFDTFDGWYIGDLKLTADYVVTADVDAVAKYVKIIGTDGTQEGVEWTGYSNTPAWQTTLTRGDKIVLTGIQKSTANEPFWSSLTAFIWSGEQPNSGENNDGGFCMNHPNGGVKDDSWTYLREDPILIGGTDFIELIKEVGADCNVTITWHWAFENVIYCTMKLEKGEKSVEVTYLFMKKDGVESLPDAYNIGIGADHSYGKITSLVKTTGDYARKYEMTSSLYLPNMMNTVIEQGEKFVLTGTMKGGSANSQALTIGLFGTEATGTTAPSYVFRVDNCINIPNGFANAASNALDCGWTVALNSNINWDKFVAINANATFTTTIDWTTATHIIISTHVVNGEDEYTMTYTITATDSETAPLANQYKIAFGADTATISATGTFVTAD